MDEETILLVEDYIDASSACLVRSGRNCPMHIRMLSDAQLTM